MILLCGIPSERPIDLVWRALNELGMPVVMWNQRRFAVMDLTVELGNHEVRGRLRIGGQDYHLEDFRGVYTRAIPESLLPEIQGLPENSPLRQRCSELHALLHAWCEVAPCRVVNRVSSMGSNVSKPYQAQIIRRFGFSVPETLITNEPEEALAFRARHGTVIYKSISGIRSIVRTLDDEDIPYLERIRCCPVQFQALIQGTDVRVHVVGEDVYATEIRTSGIDYRYAEREPGCSTAMRATALSDDISERCVRLSRSLGLPFSGIDLRLAPDGRVYCFEVNPCPGFSYYEASTGQPISRAVACYLAG